MVQLAPTVVATDAEPKDVDILLHSRYPMRQCQVAGVSCCLGMVRYLVVAIDITTPYPMGGGSADAHYGSFIAGIQRLAADLRSPTGLREWTLCIVDRGLRRLGRRCPLWYGDCGKR